MQKTICIAQNYSLLIIYRKFTPYRKLKIYVFLSFPLIEEIIDVDSRYDCTRDSKTCRGHRVKFETGKALECLLFLLLCSEIQRQHLAGDLFGHSMNLFHSLPPVHLHDKCVLNTMPQNVLSLGKEHLIS